MNFIETIKTDMYSAMKSGEKSRAGTLRTLLAKLKDRQIEKGETITEQEGLSVIKMLVKQRKESMELYQQASRFDLVEVADIADDGVRYFRHLLAVEAPQLVSIS